MPPGGLLGEEDSGRLADVMRSSLTPRDVLSSLLVEDPDLLAIDEQVAVVLLGDGAVEPAVDRVVLQLVDHVIDLHEGVIDGHQPYVLLG